MRRIHPSLLPSFAAGVFGQVLVPWTTDYSTETDAKIGPDGPWQAVVVNINDAKVPLWPSGSDFTELLTEGVNGSWAPGASATKTSHTSGNSDKWRSNLFVGGGFFGDVYYDNMTVGDGSGDDALVNATITAASEWNENPNASSHAPTIGALGLGTKSARGFEDDTVAGLLAQLKANGDIDREAWSLHMGSAALDLSGSLVLGGYEQNRALGEVATFRMEDGLPRVFLRDVTMGTETGAPSSLPATPDGSFWVPPANTNGTNYNELFRGAQGSGSVFPNPVSPYIYLQPGICEGLADNLGLKYNGDVNLYTWESTRNGSIEGFLNSPAYLGFVFADKTATNFTVKVPFKLLNLTLEPPLVEKRVNYFPCQSVNSTTSNVGQLGRAFLQAAFLGVDYEGEVMHIAQAPGPSLEQSVIRKFESSAIETNPAESFQSTWSNSWTVANASDRPPGDEDGKMSTSGKVAVVLATVLGIIAALWHIRRRWKKKRGPEAPPDVVDRVFLQLKAKSGWRHRTAGRSDTSLSHAREVAGGYAMEQKAIGQGHYNELDSRESPAEIGDSGMKTGELDSTTKPAEMGATAELQTETTAPGSFGRQTMYEAPSDNVVCELPASPQRNVTRH